MRGKACWNLQVTRQIASFAFAPLYLAVSYEVLAQNSDMVVEEVFVTGTYIASSSEDEASPVEVLSNDYIANSGAVDIGELTKKLSVSSGAENNPDSFTSGETQGTSNVNLRGLGDRKSVV